MRKIDYDDFQFLIKKLKKKFKTIIFVDRIEKNLSIIEYLINKFIVTNLKFDSRSIYRSILQREKKQKKINLNIQKVL